MLTLKYGALVVFVAAATVYLCLHPLKCTPGSDHGLRIGGAMLMEGCK